MKAAIVLVLILFDIFAAFVGFFHCPCPSGPKASDSTNACTAIQLVKV